MRLLLIEDEKSIAQSIKTGLEQESYSVDIANEGDLGYDLALSEEYDAIILDLMLPNMSGEQICRMLRKNNITTPILMLTAKNDVQNKIDGLNLGADDYLTKPFSFDELVARIKALLRRPQNSLNTTLTCQDLTLNTISSSVTKKNKQIQLSKTEFALLEYLLRNKNKIVSKEKIMQNVWNFDADILPNNVEVYIGYLRKKLGKPNLIKTVRGFGYKMECKNV